MDFSKWNKEKLHEEFKEAKPFSHLVLDHFLDDAHANALLEEIKEYDPIYFPAEDVVHDTAMKSNKRCLTDSRMFGPIARAFVEQSRTKEMIAFLENSTGIDNLEADPYYKLHVHRDLSLTNMVHLHRGLFHVVQQNKKSPTSYQRNCLQTHNNTVEHHRVIPKSPTRLSPFG